MVLEVLIILGRAKQDQLHESINFCNIKKHQFVFKSIGMSRDVGE